MRPIARGPALGIDLGGTKIEAVLLDAEGRAAWRQRQATPTGDYAGTLQVIAGLVGEARAQVPGTALPIGIGTPGSLAASGVIKNANSTCLNGRPLERDLEQLLGQRVAMSNDANCLALSEATDGAGRDAPVVFAVILGTGVGAGIAVDGRVLTGPNRIAGEWGHNPLPWADPARDGWPLCYCGQRGCIEALLSGPALARDHLAHGGPSMAAAEVHAHALGGDAAAAATLDRHAHRLARALASVINLLDPDVIVLGGGLSLMPHLYLRVPALWGEWVFSAGAADPVRTRLVPALHGDASGVRGAAWLGAAATSAGTGADSCG